MKRKILSMAAYVLALMYFAGCTGVALEVQSGRNALQTGRPNDAVISLTRAADANPSYRIPYRVRTGVLSYLGRAYYETGKDQEARVVLEKAVTLHDDDPLAHLYLGLTLLRAGDAERGRKEIAVGLRAIDDTLEFITSDHVTGYFWDPSKQIRSDVRKTLSGNLNASELAFAAQRIGAQFDEEIDKARRDEARSRGGNSGGGGE